VRHGCRTAPSGFAATGDLICAQIPQFGRKSIELDAPEKHEDHNDNQNGAQHTDTAMAKAIAVTPEAATEASQQENNQDDYKYES
jgi:hypothetical protein